MKDILAIPYPEPSSIDTSIALSHGWAEAWRISTASSMDLNGHVDFASKDAAEYRSASTTEHPPHALRRNFLLVDNSIDDVVYAVDRYRAEGVQVVASELAFDDVVGRAVGLVQCDMGTKSNLESAGVHIFIDSSVRRAGIGSAALDFARSVAVAHGRSRISGWTRGSLSDEEHGFAPRLGGGYVSRDDAGAAFLNNAGFGLELIEKISSLDLTDPDLSRRLDTLEESKAEALSTFRFKGLSDFDADMVTEEYLDAVFQFAQDLPTSEDFEPRRHSKDEAKQLQANSIRLGWRSSEVRAYAPDGSLIGFSELNFKEGGTQASQAATWVHRDYRGRGLSLLLKTQNLRRIMEMHPGLVRVSTENAEENAPMLAVNTKLGFRVESCYSEWLSYERGGQWRPDKDGGDVA